MGLKDLPTDYPQWLVAQESHLQNDLDNSKYTKDLYKQYRKHLGPVRYKLLLEAQILVVPKRVNELLDLGKLSLIKPILGIYKLTRLVKLDWFLKSALLPPAYKEEIKELDVV
jgi:hypothetical protein